MKDPKHQPTGGSHPEKKPKTIARFDFDIDEALKKQPEWVQRELEGLKKHQDAVLRALQSDENKALFLRDPARLLRSLDIPISGPLKNRLRADPSVAELDKPLCIKLPNGQSIRPKLRINFTR